MKAQADLLTVNVEFFDILVVIIQQSLQPCGLNFMDAAAERIIQGQISILQKGQRIGDCAKIVGRFMLGLLCVDHMLGLFAQCKNRLIVHPKETCNDKNPYTNGEQQI